MTLEVIPADRLGRLPPYLFAEVDRAKHEAMARGEDVIDLGVGDPDLPTPSHILGALERAARDPANHRYPSYMGLGEFKDAVAAWYKLRFNVLLAANVEVLSLIGSKEGIAHLPLALINPGDTVLIPDPAYPVYLAATHFAGGEPYIMPLEESRGFLPDLDAIPEEVARKAKLMFVNYPNNPTGAVADKFFYQKCVDFAKRHGILVAHDAAYTELYFEGQRPMSMLEIPGAKDVCIEFHSCSKTYNMTGWRVAFAVGHRGAVKALGDIKKNVDSGVFQAVQHAAIAAVTGLQTCVAENNRIYEERRNILVAGLIAAGFDAKPQRATFYLWVKAPRGVKSTAAATRILKEAAVVSTPGVGFGAHGEGYIRFAVTQPKERIAEAVDRIKGMSW